MDALGGLGCRQSAFGHYDIFWCHRTYGYPNLLILRVRDELSTRARLLSEANTGRRLPFIVVELITSVCSKHPTVTAPFHSPPSLCVRESIKIYGAPSFILAWLNYCKASPKKEQKSTRYITIAYLVHHFCCMYDHANFVLHLLELVASWGFLRGGRKMVVSVKRHVETGIFSNITSKYYFFWLVGENDGFWAWDETCMRVGAGAFLFQCHFFSLIGGA